MSVLKKLASETASYGISTILGRVLNFLLVPIHTGAFGPKESNLNVELYSYAAILSILYSFGMETTFFRFAPQNKERYYNIIQTAVIAVSLCFSVSMIVFATPIMNFLDEPGKEKVLIWLAIIMFIDGITYIPFARLRLEKSTSRFVKAKIVNILVNIGLNIFFLAFLKRISDGDFLPSLLPLAKAIYNPEIGIGYIFLANLIANLTYFLFLLPEFEKFKFQFDKEELKKLWEYGYPIMLMVLMSSINLMFDRVFLKKLLPDNFYEHLTKKEVLGIYGNAYKLSVFMSLATQAFRYAAEPFFLSKNDDKNSPETLALVTKWFFMTCLFIWLGVSLNLDWLKILFLRQKVYWQGISIVPIILLANLFLGVYYNISVWFKLNNKTYYGTLTTAIGLVVTIVLNIILIPQIGFMGSAIAFMISSFTMMAVCYLLGQKHYPVPYDVQSIMGYIISAGLLIYCVMKIEFHNLWLSIPYHLVLLLLYTAGVVIVERKTIIPLKIRDKYKILR